MKQTIHTILAQFREDVASNRELGDRFERLICRYLELDPIYAERFSRVWMWNEFPQKGNVGDVGIDLVAEERATGEPSGARSTAKGSPQGERGGVHQFCAIQCKFYLPDHTLAKGDIDSFFTASGKSLFTSCMIVSTTDKWGTNAEHALAHQSKPVTRLRVHDLDESPVDWSKFDPKRPQDLGQELALLSGAPSLSALSQSLRAWIIESHHPLHGLAVCFVDLTVDLLGQYFYGPKSMSLN